MSLPPREPDDFWPRVNAGSTSVWQSGPNDTPLGIRFNSSLGTLEAYDGGAGVVGIFQSKTYTNLASSITWNAISEVAGGSMNDSTALGDTLFTTSGTGSTSRVKYTGTRNALIRFEGQIAVDWTPQGVRQFRYTVKNNADTVSPIEHVVTDPNVGAHLACIDFIFEVAQNDEFGPVFQLDSLAGGPYACEIRSKSFTVTLLKFTS